MLAVLFVPCVHAGFGVGELGSPGSGFSASGFRDVVLGPVDSVGGVPGGCGVTAGWRPVGRFLWVSRRVLGPRFGGTGPRGQESGDICVRG